MEIRKAIAKDIPELNRVSIASKKHWGYPDEWIANWLDELTLTPEKFVRQNILVGELNGEIIGFCSITESESEYEILHLWVVPQFIGQGYGKKILTRTMDEFVTSDKPIIVEADPNAESFYKSLGFETFDKVESFPKGRLLPVMKKKYRK